MGKGNRNSQKRTLEQQNNAQKFLDKQKNDKKKKTGERATAIACIVFAVLIAASLAVNIMQENGVFIRQQSAMETENVEVDSAMLSFFYNDYLMNWYNSNHDYLAYYSLDLTYDLSSQLYGGGYEIYFLGEYDGTWYDYFLDQILREVEMYIQYAEGAKATGLDLSDEDYTEIDTIVDNIKASLKASGAKFSDWYGRGVKEKDVRRCYELIYLASNFADYKTEKLEEALDKDDAAVLTYVEENKANFYSAEYLSYEIKLSSKDFANDEAYDAAVAQAKLDAEKIAEAKTPAEFVEFVENYKLENAVENETETETGSETETETLSSEDELESKIEGYKSKVNYQTSNDLGKWIFEESAAVNDTKVIEQTGTETETEDESDTEEDDTAEDTKTYNTYSAKIYLITTPSSLDKSLTKDAAFLVADSKEDVEKFVNEFKAGTTNVENFVSVAQKHEEALHEGQSHEEGSVEPLFSYNGVEKMPNKYFADAYNELNVWLDSGECVDDTLSEIFEIVIKGTDGNEDTTYYAVVYFEKYNDEAWYASAYDLTVNKQFEDWYKEQGEVTPISYNDKALANINTLKLNH